jgi:hypothetical protein
MGWKLEPGMRYRGVLKVLDYELVQKGVFTNNRIASVPQKEVHFPAEIVFPLANMRKLCIENMTQQGSLPDVTVSMPLPFAEEANDKTIHDDRPIILPPVQQRFGITFLRIEKYGGTSGCVACKEFNYTAGRTPLTHTKECRQRFRSMMEKDGTLQPTVVEVSNPTTAESIPTIQSMDEETAKALNNIDNAFGASPQEAEEVIEDTVADMFGDFDDNGEAAKDEEIPSYGQAPAASAKAKAKAKKKAALNDDGIYVPPE